MTHVHGWWRSCMWWPNAMCKLIYRLNWRVVLFIYIIDFLIKIKNMQECCTLKRNLLRFQHMEYLWHMIRSTWSVRHQHGLANCKFILMKLKMVKWQSQQSCSCKVTANLLTITSVFVQSLTDSNWWEAFYRRWNEWRKMNEKILMNSFFIFRMHCFPILSYPLSLILSEYTWTVSAFFMSFFPVDFL